MWIALYWAKMRTLVNLPVGDTPTSRRRNRPLDYPLFRIDGIRLIRGKANARSAPPQFVPPLRPPPSLGPTSKWHRFSFQLEQLQKDGERIGRREGGSAVVIWQRPGTRISR